MSGARRHPFIDDLAQHVTLASSILRRPVSGRGQVLKIVKAGTANFGQRWGHGAELAVPRQILDQYLEAGPAATSSTRPMDRVPSHN